MNMELTSAEAEKIALVPVPAVYDRQVQLGETCEGGTYDMTIDFPCDSDTPFRVHVMYTSRDGGGSATLRRTECGRFLGSNGLDRWYIGDDAEQQLPWVVYEGYKTRSFPLERIGDSSNESSS
jgi:hypothetical protein